MQQTKKSPKYRTVQAYFRGVLANERRIQYLEAEIEKQQSRLSLNGVMDGEVVNKTMEGSSFAEGFTKLYDAVDAMDTELIGYLDERTAAREVLSHIAETKGYEIIFLRYLEGYRLNDIARMLFMSRQHAYRLHEESLIALYPHIPAEYRQGCCSKIS